MCDILIKRDLTKQEIPKFVYKRVQKIAEGKYVSPVMGEPMKLGEWKKAPSRPTFEDEHGRGDSMINFLKRSVAKKFWPGSSVFSSRHDGKWGVFQFYADAKQADLVSNFVTKEGKLYPTVVVKCEIKGEVHQSAYSGLATYLASHIKIVGESGKAH